MSITTTPVFYYGYTVTVNNIYLNFNEGGAELTGIVSAGNYSFTALGQEIERVLNSYGTQLYTVAANRSARTFTISAPSTFSLLFASGSNAGLGVGSIIGFTTDQTGSLSYTGSATGSEFIPQFPLQDYTGLDDYQEYSSATINESESGKVETFSVGLRKFMEFNIGPITNNSVAGLFRKTTDAVGDLRSFMTFIISKSDIEFMPDETDRSTYYTIVLERTPTSSTGTGFKLNELYSKGLVGFFETGKLRFRKRD